MRVEFLEGAVGDLVHYKGDQVELPDQVAKRYIAAGTCKPAPQSIRRRRRGAGAAELAVAQKSEER